jgi:hypothetical protein
VVTSSAVGSVARFALGGVRLAMGSTALIAPTAMVRRLGGDPANEPTTAYPWRLFGVRTVLLAGELLLLGPGPRRTFALRIAPFIHASDLTAALLAGRDQTLPEAAARTAATVSAINTVLSLLAQLERPRMKSP